MNLPIAASLIVAGVALLGIGAAAWSSSVRDKARALDVTIDALLDSDPDEEPEVDGDPEPPRAALTPEQVLAMTPGQIAALCRPLDAATAWCIHPALQRRKPRPGRDPFDFFANGGMS